MGGPGRHPGTSEVSTRTHSTSLTPSAPTNPSPPQPHRDALLGDGFTTQELQEATRPRTREPWHPWHPSTDYTDCDIRDLYPGPGAVTFMGRIASVFDVTNTPKTPRSAKGCVKLSVKDDTGAITVRLWFAAEMPSLCLGSLVSIWTNHISNGENGTLSSATAPLFASIFPERDRSCHLMVHENSDDGSMCTKPLGFRSGQPLSGLMTLQNFIDGGCDVVDAKILVVVKSVGVKKRITRKDESVTENINLKIHDDTAEATLGLWGTMASSPLSQSDTQPNTVNPEAAKSLRGWTAGETVLLLQSPSCKLGRGTYLTLTSSTLIDINPSIPDTLWLRTWSLRTLSHESLNPPFPTPSPFTLPTTSPLRCLYTLADLDEFARAAPQESFQGYLSLLLTEVNLYSIWKRRMLFAGECAGCGTGTYANATEATCKACEKGVELRLNPRVVGQVMDETGCIGGGKLVFCDRAWRELLGCSPGELLELDGEEFKWISDRLLFCRVTVMFGWSAEAAGERICVLGVLAA